MKEKKSVKSKVLQILFYFFLIVFIVALGYILLFKVVKPMLENASNQKHKTSYSINSGNPQASTAELVDNPVDFSGLQKENSDIYSWIEIENTNIDYPIYNPYGKDDSFYLRRGKDKTYLHEGVIYTENQTSTDWSDRVSLVYGHNIWTMQTMFYELHNFENAEFFDKTKTMMIYAPGEIRTYEIYSAFEYDDRHVLNAFDFTDDTVYQEFIDYTKNPTTLVKQVREETSVTIDDKIVVLSTCIKNKPNNRYLVVGVLKNVQKTK